MKTKTKTKLILLSRMFAVILMSGMLMGCPSDPDPDPPTLALNPSSINFTKEQGVKRELKITASSDATWTVLDNGWSDWLSLSTTSGKGSMTISLTTKNVNTGGSISVDLEVVAQNGGGETRQRVKLTRESGAVEPDDWYLTLNGATTDTKNYRWEGESQSVKIETNDRWQASSSESWCKVSPVNGEKDGFLTISVDKNMNEGSSRQAIVRIEGLISKIVATVTIVQEPKNPDTIISRDEYEDDKDLNGQGQTTYALAVSPTTMTFSSGGAQYTATITSNDTWTVNSDQSWCTVSPTNGSNNGNITVKATANTTTASRNATVTIKGANSGKTVTIAVTQEGKTTVGRDEYEDDKSLDGSAPIYTLSVDLSSLYISQAGETKNVNITSNDSWTVSSSQSWCTVSPTSGSNNGTVRVTTLPNTSSSSRNAKVTVKGTSSGISVTINVSQEAGTSIGRNEYENDKEI